MEIVEQIEKRVEFIAPITVMPGEKEMEALADGFLRALCGEIPMLEFVPKAGKEN